MSADMGGLAITLISAVHEAEFLCFYFTQHHCAHGNVFVMIGRIDLQDILSYVGFIEQRSKQMKTEIVCILRQGYSILHTEGLDFAAKVTELRYEPGKVHDAGIVKQELLIPLFPGF